MIPLWALPFIAGVAVAVVLLAAFVWCGMQDDGKDRGETDYD